MNSDISNWYKSNLDAISEIVSEVCKYAANRKRRNFIQNEVDYYNSCTTIHDYRIYLEVYPNGKFHKDAKNRIEDINRKEKEKKEAEKRKKAALSDKIKRLSNIDECVRCYTTDSPRY